MVEYNSDISKNEPNIVNDILEQENNDAGAAVINEDGVNDNIDNIKYIFRLRRSLRNAKNTRFTHRNRFEREFQYM